MNLGVDMSLLASRLSITADVYQTTKEDMLLPLMVPPSAGAGSNSEVILNVGDMSNKGVELMLAWNDKVRDLTYGATFTASRNVNEVTKMAGTNKRFPLGKMQNVSNSDYVTYLVEGQEAGAFYLYPTNGVIDTEEKLVEYSELRPTARMGDLMYVDTDKDGEITEDDRVYKGSGAPEVELGLNINLAWNRFDFSMMWYASIGNEVLNGSKCKSYQQGRHLDMLSSWNYNNPYSPIPARRNAGEWNNHLR